MKRMEGRFMATAYLDNSATTRPCDAAVEQMLHAMREDFYNPSALYAPAMGPEKMMKKCREKILQSVHAPQGSRGIHQEPGHRDLQTEAADHFLIPCMDDEGVAAALVA